MNNYIDKTALISIIVPVYNVSEYLEVCLDSLVNQTYRNIEIILINDGSTDGSGAICDKYAERFPDIITVVHTNNSGVSAARNNGLKRAKGSYIAFVDSDDWIEQEMIEFLFVNLLENNADISCCGIKYDYNNGQSQLDKTIQNIKCNQNELFREIIENSNVYGYVYNKLFKRSILEDLQFDETLMVCEDMEFTTRYVSKCKRGVYNNSQLYHYRQRRGSMTGEFSYNPNMLSIISAYEKIMSVYENMCPEYSYILLKNYLKINLNLLGRMKLCRYHEENMRRILVKNIRDNYRMVICDRRNSILSRVNIWISCRAPKLMLKLKQIILKRKYK